MSTDTNDSRDVALGFVDGDSNLDAIFGNISNNRVCLGNGAGGFTCSNVSGDTNDSERVALGDVDNNSTLDAVFANSNNQTNHTY